MALITKEQFLNNPIISDRIWEIWLASACSSKYQLRPDGKGALFQHFQSCAYDVYLEFDRYFDTPEEIMDDNVDFEGASAVSYKITPEAFWDAKSGHNAHTGITQKKLNEKFFNIVDNHKELDNEPGYFNQLNFNFNI